MHSFAKFLSIYHVEYDVIIKDIGAVITEQARLHESQPSLFKVNDFAYDKYHPIAEIHAWIDQMAQQYPSLASSFVIGQSYEKRDLKALKISSSKVAKKHDGTPVNAKKAVWWDGGKVLNCFHLFDVNQVFNLLGIHAREWISPATNIYIAHTLLSNYSKDATITQLVDQFDFYILPVFNVDGYAYTWTNGKNEINYFFY